jgi:L-cysteine S-thiosulfotransferase
MRVGRNFAGRPILSAPEIEDIVAFLAALRD